MKERVKEFEFQGNSYKIEFPNVGQYLDIETNKNLMSKNSFGGLLNVGTMSSFRAIQIITCASTLQVLCPKLFEDMKVKTFFELDAKDFMLLVKVYEEEIAPWYSAWFKEFNEILKLSSDENEIKEE